VELGSTGHLVAVALDDEEKAHRNASVGLAGDERHQRTASRR
jgi:hypothetical protein